MVSKEILNTLANNMKEFTYNVVNDRPVASKEEVKNLIEDLIRCCDDTDAEWIHERLNLEW